MKAQKAAICISAGLMAAVPLRLICAEQAAADTTDIVAVSISREIATVDGVFTATVYLDELPTTGLNAMDFAITYDPTILTVTDVELLYDTGADKAEAAVNPDLENTVFRYEDTGNELRICWNTALTNPDYWLQEERAFFTISGTLAETVEPNSCAELCLAPASRESYEGSGVINTLVVAGYVDENGNTFNYETAFTDGLVWKPRDESGVTIRGDVNLDGAMTISDAINLYKAVTEEQPLCAAAYVNADLEPDGLLTAADVTLILQSLQQQAENTAAAAP